MFLSNPVDLENPLEIEPDKDEMKLKLGKGRLKWDDLISDLDFSDPDAKWYLWLPKLKGRQLIFRELDLHNHRRLQEEDFGEACEALGVHLKPVPVFSIFLRIVQIEHPEQGRI